MTNKPCTWLDTYHVVFGEVVGGRDIVDKIIAMGVVKQFCTEDGVTSEKIFISDCG